MHYFHAGSSPTKARTYGVLNASHPKALIYANAPGRPLVLVGAMWTMPPGELGPTPAGQLTRWHFHLMCSAGESMAGMSAHTPNDLHSVMKLPANGGCPPGEHVRVGKVQMMHIWFTRDLRSEYGIRPPTPELCQARLVPARFC